MTRLLGGLPVPRPYDAAANTSHPSRHPKDNRRCAAKTPLDEGELREARRIDVLLTKPGATTSPFDGGSPPRWRTGPTRAGGPWPAPSPPVSSPRGQPVQGPPHRRRGRDRPQDLALMAQHVNVGDGLTAVGHQHGQVPPAPGHRCGPAGTTASLAPTTRLQSAQPGRPAASSTRFPHGPRHRSRPRSLTTPTTTTTTTTTTNACRVARAHCCARAPSEPDVRLSPHPAQASPSGVFG
jgi:hypothetical protein